MIKETLTPAGEVYVEAGVVQIFRNGKPDGYILDDPDGCDGGILVPMSAIQHFIDRFGVMNETMHGQSMRLRG